MDPIKEFGKTFEKALHGMNQIVDNIVDGSAKMAESGKDFMTRFTSNSTASPQWAQLAHDMRESDLALFVKVEMPGVAKEDCDIRVEGLELIIRGEKRVDPESLENKQHFSGRAFGFFEKRIALPYRVDESTAVASLQNGVLTIELHRPLFESDGRVNIQ